jgi:hypothetical protein
MSLTLSLGAKDMQSLCGPPAPKTDKQRTQQKAQNIAKKQRLNTAICSTIEKIDELIGALADEYDIGFAQACNYVHLGGRIFKDRRRPSIQNAYRFCLARVEDERCKSHICCIES